MKSYPGKCCQTLTMSGIDGEFDPSILVDHTYWTDMLSLSNQSQTPVWKAAVPTQKMNAILVYRNLLIVSEGQTLQTYNIRTRERTSLITTTKKCISLFIDSSAN